MTRDACPHEPAVRPKLCKDCCAQHALPPCARGWLAAQLTELRWERRRLQARRAAERRRAA
ncbi:hypothetical protein HRbin29_00302 [bacterium HR29]|nr:hypothetical protein HRbin29_00302 [bacterium HR29]